MQPFQPRGGYRRACAAGERRGVGGAGGGIGGVGGGGVGGGGDGAGGDTGRWARRGPASDITAKAPADQPAVAFRLVVFVTVVFLPWLMTQSWSTKFPVTAMSWMDGLHMVTQGIVIEQGLPRGKPAPCRGPASECTTFSASCQPPEP